MLHCNTILSQILKVIPRYEFESLVGKHHSSRKFRSSNRRSQFTAIVLAQLSGRQSLRDFIEHMKVQGRWLYHFGVGLMSKSHLSRINNDKPYKMYEEIFGELLSRC